MIIAQFADVLNQKKEVDEKNKALVKKLNEIKAQIDDFSQRSRAIVVSRLTTIIC